MFNDRDVVILEGARTPFCRVGTLLAEVSALELGRVAVREAIERADLASSEIDEVIVGNVAGPREAENLGRAIALAAGAPASATAHTVNRSRGSALQAIAEGALRIRAGEAEVVVAAGVESVSRFPAILPGARRRLAASAAGAPSRRERLSAWAGLRAGELRPLSTLEAAMADPASDPGMGLAADRLAREFAVTREEQDAFALESHRRAARAWREGLFAGEVVPVPLPPDYASLAEKDNGMREDRTLESLGALPPLFDREYGTVTEGNSSAGSDGAAAFVLASGRKANELGAGGRALGRIRCWAFAGCDPARMGLGPAHAIPRALERAGVPLGAIGLIELDEAFAAQVLACGRAMDSRAFCRDALGLDAPPGAPDPARTNVNGGAIALGDPPGATGARLVLTLLREMARRGVSLGLAAVSIEGGQGGAIVVEKV